MHAKLSLWLNSRCQSNARAWTYIHIQMVPAAFVSRGEVRISGFPVDNSDM